MDEPGFALEGLPEVAVEASGGEVPDDLDFVVHVALADDAAFALFDIGRAPGGVEVVQGDGAVLDVGSDAHLLGGSDQDGDVPGPAGREEPGEVGVGFRLVHEPDGLAGEPARGELLAELVVGVPSGSGCPQVAEHQLQRSAYRVGSAVGCLVLVVAVGLPDRGDPAGGGGDLAGDRLRQSDQAQVQGGTAAVAGDLEHLVVHFGSDSPVADRLGAPAEVGDVADQLPG